MSCFPTTILVFFLKIINLFTKSKDLKVLKKTGYNLEKDECYDLIIADIMHAFGDFLISLHAFYNIDKLNKKTYVFVHESFKKTLDDLNFKNLHFIYNSADLGSHYNREKINLKDLKTKAKELSEILLKENIKINNVYIFGFTISLEMLAILSKVNYNNLYILQSFKNPKKIFLYSLMIPSKIIWLNYFTNIKKYNFNFLPIMYSQAVFQMTKMLDIDKNEVKFLNLSSNKISSNNKLNIAIMPYTSNRKKDLDIDILLCLLNEIKNKFDSNVFINVYGKWTSKEEKKWAFSSKNFDFKNVNLEVNKYNLNELIYEIDKNDVCITNDTSLYHIANLLNKKTIMFLNKDLFKGKKGDFLFNFWSNYPNRNNLILNLNDYFFDDYDKNPEKYEVEILLNNVVTFLEKIKKI